MSAMTSIAKPGFWMPHRIVMAALFIALIVSAALLMRWDWLPRYIPLLGQGILRTLAMLFSSAIIGFYLRQFSSGSPKSPVRRRSGGWRAASAA